MKYFVAVVLLTVGYLGNDLYIYSDPAKGLGPLSQICSFTERDIEVTDIFSARYICDETEYYTFPQILKYTATFNLFNQ